MRKLTSGICLILALSLCLGLTTALAASQDSLEAVKAAGKLVVATSPDYAPYEFLDKEGKPVGADITLAQHIADQLGVELVIDQLSFDAVLAAAATGKCDLAIAGLVPKEERKETMLFSDIYYNDGNQVIVILKENADSIKTLNDFAGKRVAAQNATLQQTLVSEQLPGAQLELISAIPDGIMMVMTGKAAGIALASVVANQYIANYPELMICESRFDYTSLGVAIAVPKTKPELLAAVNEIVKEVVDSGQFFTWVDEAVQLNNSLNN